MTPRRLVRLVFTLALLGGAGGCARPEPAVKQIPVSKDRLPPAPPPPKQ